MKLIIGLGNPGRSYAQNRHNVGFILLNHFAKEVGIIFNRKLCQARTGNGKVSNENVVIAQPQTFMNRSGNSVVCLLEKFHIHTNNLIVIHDDLDLPLGRIRLRPGGSSAGHKGIESIINELGNQDFIRIRIGIGQQHDAILVSDMFKEDPITYVLSDFSSEEKQVIKQLMPRVNNAIISIIASGLISAMNEYNRA